MSKHHLIHLMILSAIALALAGCETTAARTTANTTDAKSTTSSSDVHSYVHQTGTNL